MEYINTDKLEKLNITKDNVCIVLDFDKTITSAKSLDSWAASGILLEEAYNTEMDKLFKKYRPIELNYKITEHEKEKAMVEWYGKCMDLYYKYHLTKEKLEKSVNIANLKLREGAKEFLQKLKEENVPIIILSAGIGNVIKQFLQENNCYSNNMCIISNFLEFDENGNVKKFDNRKMIHTLNKTMKKQLNRPYKILVGDMKEDERMVDSKEWDTTLKIGILENETPDILEVYRRSFDVVLTEEDATFYYLDRIIF